MKWYTKLECKNIQHESISYLALDALRSCGATERLKETCRRIMDFHEDYDKDVAEALSLAFHGGSVQRVPEYLDTMSRMARSAAWGQAVTEDMLCDLALLQSQEAIADCLARQGLFINVLAARDPDEWVWDNQDRCVLHSLQPLPLVSPSEVASHFKSSAPQQRVQWLHSPPPSAVCSAAATWDRNS
eukprot:6283983-Amphidinium_carterae.1